MDLQTKQVTWTFKNGLPVQHPKKIPVNVIEALYIGFLFSAPEAKPFYFKSLAQLFWHDQSKHFEWHPWAEDMLEAACRHNYLAVAGCGSSGKSEFFAIWAILNYLASPVNTLVLVTSTTLKEARKRIYGSIKAYWTAMDPNYRFGKLVDSAGSIMYVDPVTGVSNEKAGIFLVAGAKMSEKEATGKFLGMKNKRCLLIGDELPELSEAMVNVAYTNLSINPYFQFVGLGNPKSYFDSFGKLAKPKAGWQSISVEDEGWETVKGYCLHIDGLQSPNAGLREPIYPYLLKQRDIDDAVAEHGSVNSSKVFRMLRGFFPPAGEEDHIYCEADIIKFEGDAPVLWMEPPTLCAALDPSFTNGGDRTILYLGEFGLSAETLLPTLCFKSYEILAEDVTLKDVPRAYQIIWQFRDRCKALGINPKYSAYDSTGGGGPFGDIIAREFSKECLPVHFGGSASEMPVSAYDNRPAFERYANRVTELWFTAMEYLRSRQIKGMSDQFIKEACARKYENIKRAGNEIPLVESKRDMKMRTGGISPDVADAGFILLELCRQRLGFGKMTKPTGPVGTKPRVPGNTYNPLPRKKNVVSSRRLVRC